MDRIVECVPNFSEGRDRATIDAIVAAATGVSGVVLLDVDPGADTNRTVVTFVGGPDEVVEAAFRAIAEAARRIDMEAHRGAHPRMGATDVCPFVPVRGVTMDDCAELARRLARRVGGELGIPVYLYGRAAADPSRASLADVRAGEYEGLAARAGKPEWRPDFGPFEFPPRTGATAIGAREFLIAYNVNLNTRSRRLAHDLALDVRESGRRVRDDAGSAVRDAAGNFVSRPGRFRECRAVGWTLPEHGLAQVSINLTDYRVTSLHDVFDALREGAQRRGLRVTGSEIVGMVPLEPIRRAGAHYLRAQGATAGVPERELVHAAVRSLGLSDLAPFDPDEKILEYRLRRAGLLADRTVREFADELSSDSAAPGGGSAAALLGTLSAALASMVAALTVGRKGCEDAWERMKELGEEAQALKDAFTADVDRDNDAFRALQAASRLPKATPAEAAARDAAVRAAVRRATEVPLEVLERAALAAALAVEVAASGNPNSRSDAGVAALAARACAEGAYYNVLINLVGLDDPEWSAAAQKRAEDALSRAARCADQAVASVRTALERSLPAPQRT
jgi:glutamate formiminotransferase/formiminotetrahydrofolate cyclodeaminase